MWSVSQYQGLRHPIGHINVPSESSYANSPSATIIILNDDSIALQIRALACHESQVFEWLPYDMGVLDEVPDRNDLPAVAAYISKYWIEPRSGADARRHGLECAHADVFCLSEYGRTPTAEEISFLSESKP